MDWSDPFNPLNPWSPFSPFNQDTHTETHTEVPTREPHSIKHSIKVDGTALAVTFGLIGALILAGVVVRCWRQKR